MTDIPPLLLAHTILFLSLPFIFGYAAFKFRLPTIIGYIAGGIALGFFVHEAVSDVLSFFAEIGLILLLFSIGLEVNLSNLKRFSRFALLGGGLQVAITALITALVLLIFKLPLFSALILGFGFALSSTAIVMKIISERGEEYSLVAQLSLGVLLFQDLLAIPAIVIITAFSSGASGGTIVLTVLSSLLKSVVIISLIFFAGERLVPPIFAKVGKFSQELISVFTIIFIFGAVFLFSILGLSSSLAAFVAGVLLSTSTQHLHIFSQMRPLRDIFVIVFFVFLGATVKIDTMLPILPFILLFSLFLILLKIIVTHIIFTKFRFHSKTSYGVAVMLSQVGEFAFIMFSLAYASELLSPQIYFFALSVTIITMTISPFIIYHREKLYIKLRTFAKKNLPSLDNYLTYAVDREPAHIEGFNIKDHIVVAGYGRVGSYIGRALQLAGLPYIAIDLNYHHVVTARASGVNIIYGDATNIDILDYVQVESATCLVASVPDLQSQEAIILNAKKLSSKITILSRVSEERARRRVKDLGVTVVVQPEFEAALSILHRLFAGLSVSPKIGESSLKRLRLEHGM